MPEPKSHVEIKSDGSGMGTEVKLNGEILRGLSSVTVEAEPGPVKITMRWLAPTLIFTGVAIVEHEPASEVSATGFACPACGRWNDFGQLCKCMKKED